MSDNISFFLRGISDTYFGDRAIPERAFQILVERQHLAEFRHLYQAGGDEVVVAVQKTGELEA